MKSAKPTEVRVGQVWRDLDDRIKTGYRHIVIARMTGHGGFWAARCDADGRYRQDTERRYKTAAFLRRANTKSGFGLTIDVQP